MKRLWAWLDRVRPLPAPVVNVTGILRAEPNHQARQLGILESLKGVRKDEVLTALELLHEFYLSQMADGIGPKIEGEPEAFFRVEEAPLIVVRDMVGIMADLSGRQKIIKARMGRERQVS